MLYLLKSSNYAKIGYTKDLDSLKKRIKIYETHNPDFQIIGIKEGGVKDERYYHDRLSGYRVKNEWFNVSIIEKVMKDGFDVPKEIDELLEVH